MNLSERNNMKKIIIAMMVCILALLLGGCGKAETQNQATQPQLKNGKVLVIYYSRTGENYGVGNIEKGNTHIVADMIAKATNADEFEIKTVESYPNDYTEATKVAKEEQSQKARPELATKIDNLADYDTVFIGYPIWWSDMPMAMYTFLDTYDLSGKTVVPFATHAGSGLANTVSTIRDLEPKATVLDGKAFLGVDAQRNPDKVQQDVNEWMKQLGR